MGIMKAKSVCRRVRELREYAGILSFVTGELRYRRDILSQIFRRISGKCVPPFSIWLSKVAEELMHTDREEMQEDDRCKSGQFVFIEIWRKNADELYHGSSLKKEDMEYIYNLGQTIGYLDVQAQEQGLALLQEDLGRHIKRLEEERKDHVRLSIVVGCVTGVLLIILLM